jgi:uncharacterized protein HemY
LKKAIGFEIDTSNSMSWFHLGSLYFEQEQYEEAEKALSSIEKHRWPQYWNLLAKVYSRLGKNDEARDAFDKVSADPD